MIAEENVFTLQNSTQDVAEWGATVNEDDDEEVFEHHGGYVEYDGGMSRGTSHRSIVRLSSDSRGEYGIHYSTLLVHRRQASRQRRIYCRRLSIEAENHH